MYLLTTYGFLSWQYIFKLIANKSGTILSSDLNMVYIKIMNHEDEKKQNYSCQCLLLWGNIATAFQLIGKYSFTEACSRFPWNLQRRKDKEKTTPSTSQLLLPADKLSFSFSHSPCFEFRLHLLSSMIEKLQRCIICSLFNNIYLHAI